MSPLDAAIFGVTQGETVKVGIEGTDRKLILMMSVSGLLRICVLKCILILMKRMLPVLMEAAVARSLLTKR